MPPPRHRKVTTNHHKVTASLVTMSWLKSYLMTQADVKCYRRGESQVQEFLTVRDVASALRVTPEWVRRHVRQGDLPAIRAGVYLRVCAQDLAVWIRAKRYLPATRASLPHTLRQASRRRSWLPAPDILEAYIMEQRR